MPTFRLRHFSNPETLKAIAPQRLLNFLDPFREFFASRNCTLPPVTSADGLDHQALVDVFMSPDGNTPKDLLDALFLVDEMSTPEGMDALLDAAQAAELALDPGSDHSPSDIAVQVWLLDRDILERKHAEQFLYRAKSFEYFQSDAEEPPPFNMPSLEAHRNLERELDDWFEHKKRGRGTRVFIYPKDDAVWFLVQHGEPFKREDSLQEGDVSSVCYRPLKHDVVVYDRRLGELRVNARLVGEKRLYCQQFGKHLFGDETCFPSTSKYTLEPLREYGADALACGDVQGIEWITLTEVHLFWGGAQREIEIRKALDVFAALSERQRELPEHPRIIKAVFKVKFADSKTPRSVTIRPSNIATYTRDSDAALVEQWLELRGFIVHEETTQHEAVTEILAGD
ncbi:MAG: hypothetical protein KatS3mg082_2566 [Nitrospiraceae bacterium]|nr:MAG: hypothetical protein KatS3mg082_2566 [Nitrospiraceae bacterium]